MIKTGILTNTSRYDNFLSMLSDINTFKIIGTCNGIPIQNYESFRRFSSYDELLDNVDAVIADAEHNNFDLLRSAIRRSKHIFAEPPFPYSMRQTSELIDLCEEAEIVFQIGFKHRFNPAFLAAKPFISNDIRMLQTQRFIVPEKNYHKKSVIMDLMIHDIDIVLSQIRSNIKKINAYAVSTTHSSPDVANALIEFDNGCIANLTASRIASKNKHKAIFFNPNNYIDLDYLNYSAKLIHKENQSDTSLFHQKQSGMIIESIPVKNANETADEFRAFSQAILSQSAAEVSLENSYKTMEVAREIMDKIKLTSNCS